MNDNGSATLRWYALKVYFNKVSDMEEMLGEENVECYVPYLDQVCAKEEDSKKRQVAIPSLMFFHSSPLEARRVQQVVRGDGLYTSDFGGVDTRTHLGAGDECVPAGGVFGCRWPGIFRQ